MIPGDLPPLDRGVVWEARFGVDDTAHPDRPRVSRATPTDLPRGFAAGLWHRFPPRVRAFALCVARHESWNAGLWTAENPSSSASGFAQWIDSTWRVNAARAGVRVPGHASGAAPADQARVFAWMVTHGGRSAWSGTGCPGT